MLEKGLVGHWTMNSTDVQNGIITDRSAYNYHGELNGCEYEATGPLGHSILLTSHIDIPRDKDVSDWTQWTVSFWMNPNGFSNRDNFGRTIFSSSYSGAGDNYMIWIMTDESSGLKIYAFSADVDNYYETPSDLFEENAWYHVSISAEKNGDLIIYVDGEEVDRGTSQNGSNYQSTGWCIGDLRPDRDITFDGYISDMRVYDRILSPDEVSALYNLRNQKYTGLPQDKGLIGHWSMDDRDMSESTIHDRSAYNNHAQMEGNISTGEDGIIGESHRLDGSSRITFDREIDGFPKTLSIWMKPYSSESASHPTIFGDDMGGNGNYSGIAIQFNSSDQQISVQIGDGNGVGPNNRRSHAITTTIQDDQWYHIVAVCESLDEVDIYINGENTSYSTSGTASSVGYSTDSGVIGYRDSGSNYFSGYVDDAKMYDRTLTEQEVINLYNSRGAYTHI